MATEQITLWILQRSNHLRFKTFNTCQFQMLLMLQKISTRLLTGYDVVATTTRSTNFNTDMTEWLCSGLLNRECESFYMGSIPTVCANLVIVPLK